MGLAVACMACSVLLLVILSYGGLPQGLGRWQLLISAANRELLRGLLERIEAEPVPAGVRRVIDVDPISTL